MHSNLIHLVSRLGQRDVWVFWPPSRQPFFTAMCVVALLACLLLQVTNGELGRRNAITLHSWGNKTRYGAEFARQHFFTLHLSFVYPCCCATSAAAAAAPAGQRVVADDSRTHIDTPSSDTTAEMPH